MSTTATVDIRRAGDRAATKISWLDSKHSFSFSDHYDPANTHHGLLLVNNDDIVTPGMGFDTHPHQDMEIVTWVLRGSLVPQDSTGHSGVIYPGLAQRMSAGRGILPGTTQAALFAHAKEKGYRCKAKPLTVEYLEKADSVWLVSSVRVAARVTRLNDKKLKAPDNVDVIRDLIDAALGA
mgnify:CR=1 FL=1